MSLGRLFQMWGLKCEPNSHRLNYLGQLGRVWSFPLKEERVAECLMSFGEIVPDVGVEV